MTTGTVDTAGGGPDVPQAIRVLAHVVGHDAVDEAQAGVELGLPPAVVRATLRGLEADGLVARLDEPYGRGPSRWVAQPPRAALTGLLARRRRELDAWERLRDELTHRAGAGRDDAGTEVVGGPRDVGAAYRGLLESATRELLHLVKPPLLAPDPDAPDPDADVGGADDTWHVDPGVDVRSVYESETFTDPVSLATALQGRTSSTRLRLTPHVPFKLVIVDRRAAMIPVGGPDAGDSSLVVRAPALVEALAELFERVWDAAVPQELWRSHDGGPSPEAPGQAPDRAALPPRTRSLLDLMAGGLTDEAIGQALGISRRTVQSEVSHLAELLGARTRFQIALLASERGLVTARARRPS